MRWNASSNDDEDMLVICNAWGLKVCIPADIAPLTFT